MLQYIVVAHQLLTKVSFSLKVSPRPKTIINIIFNIKFNSYVNSNFHGSLFNKLINNLKLKLKKKQYLNFK